MGMKKMHIGGVILNLTNFLTNSGIMVIIMVQESMKFPTKSIDFIDNFHCT